MKNAKLLLFAVLFGVIATFAPIACASTGTVVSGQSVTIFLKTCDGTAPFTFQWQKNGTAITGATGIALPSGTVGIAGSAYTIATVATTDAGVYTCIVTNPGGSTTSDTATLTFIVGPSGAITGVMVNGVLQP
jgi:hypothetical protein